MRSNLYSPVEGTCPNAVQDG
uniref:Uncharacterized protein n=1 Tax=Arundo donax TaxID=35708 RepID=A0A0A9BSW6_ARUDO